MTIKNLTIVLAPLAMAIALLLVIHFVPTQIIIFTFFGTAFAAGVLLLLFCGWIIARHFGDTK